jgi:ribosomal protein S18 acetylase RimI-like enzyme
MTAEDNSYPRPAQPQDYDAIAAVIDAWWGRPVLGSLPRVFFDLFHHTSLVVDGAAGPDAFLVGILSPSDPRQAYIHFVGVCPTTRQRGLGRALYEQFFAMARADGRREVSAITAPVNTGSIAFHESMGFTVTGPVPAYNGPGANMMLFRRSL